MAKTWIIDNPITPDDLNRFEAGTDKANISIPQTDFTRAPGSGTTGGTSAALTATISGFTLTDMASANIKLHVDIAAGATININGTGAKPIYNALGRAIEANAKSGGILSLVYNSSNGRYYITGSTASAAAAGTTAGTATTLSVTPSSSFVLVDMASISIKLHVDIGNAATIDVGGTGPKGIYTSSGRAVLAKAAVAGSIITLVYNATQGRYYAIGLSEITAMTVIDTDIKRERWTGDGTAKVFNFTTGSYIVGGNRILFITVGQVPQLLNVSYTESSTTSITFSEAPAAGMIIDLIYVKSLFGDGVDFGVF